MKKITILLLLSVMLTKAFSQDLLQDKIKPIIKQGKMIYQLEMANWTASKLFAQKYKGKEKAAGYVSYIESDKVKTVFYFKADKLKSLAMFTFDESFDEKNTQVDMISRILTPAEIELTKLRASAMKAIDDASFFVVPADAHLSVIPMVSNGEHKVYVMSESDKPGVVVFGNDYVLNYSNDLSLKSKSALHGNVVMVNYEVGAVNTNDKLSSHTLVGKDEEMVSPIDIATLFLYKKDTRWRQHSFISEKYIFFWNYETESLNAIAKKAPPAKD